jgi:hypothetical protein
LTRGPANAAELPVAIAMALRQAMSQWSFF